MNKDRCLYARLSLVIAALCYVSACVWPLSVCRANEDVGPPRLQTPGVRPHYDVVIVGGSTAAFAAAVSSAQSGAATALIEPTNWVGGQLTSSGVPAVDEAWHKIRDDESGEVLVDVAAIARDPRNMSPLFRDMLLATGNPGRGWVSRFCFEPKIFLATHLQPLARSLEPKLDVFLDTVIKRAEVDRTARKIVSVEAIQRFAKEGVAHHGYDRFLSQDLADWYSAEESNRFAKQVLKFSGSVFIDGSEWGELLAVTEASYRIGVEASPESEECNEQAGQAITYGFVQRLAPQPTYEPGQGTSATGLGYGDYEDREDAWRKIWTYRRIRGGGDGPTVGDLSLQNWGYSAKRGHGGNDYPFKYLFKTRESTSRELADWQGGVKRDVLDAAEQRALAWHAWFRAQAPPPWQSGQVELATTVLGTGHGLSKVPYIRDTRRSVGIEGFVLRLDDLVGCEGSPLAHGFADSIAIGAYATDIHPLADVTYPDYVHQSHATRPFTLPLRALTNRDLGNLLVAGKTMAQTFMANSATRLHPIEWSSGTAAGVVGAHLAASGQSTRDVCSRPEQIRALVKAKTPIEWQLD